MTTTIRDINELQDRRIMMEKKLSQRLPSICT